MKKFLLFLILSSGFETNAQTLLSENFEGTTFPPTGWTANSIVATRPWQFTSNFPTSTSGFVIAGTKSAGVDYIVQANIANLITPAFSLVGATSPSLSFKVKVGWNYMINIDAGDLSAQISTDGGTNWATLWDEDSEPGFTDDGDGNPNTDLYNTVNVQRSLTPYIGQANVKIRFQYEAIDADAISIDDVKIVSGVLATNEVGAKAKSLNIYPNPTKGEINIKTDKKIKSSSIADLTGKSILKSSEGKINISSLPKGTYLVQIEFTDGTSSSEKVIKE